MSSTNYLLRTVVVEMSLRIVAWSLRTACRLRTIVCELSLTNYPLRTIVCKLSIASGLFEFAIAIFFGGGMVFSDCRFVCANYVSVVCERSFLSRLCFFLPVNSIALSRRFLSRYNENSPTHTVIDPNIRRPNIRRPTL
jgi:hypothetical protein